MNHPGLPDFWAVYHAHYDEILADTMRVATAHLEFGPIVRSMSPEQLAKDSVDSRERLRAAIEEGTWAPYEAELRVQGVVYAKLGISFAGWYDLVGAFKNDLVPLLIRAYAGDHERLARALRGMQVFVDRVMVIIGEEYLNTKQKLYEQQRELARLLEQPGRFFTLSLEMLCIAGTDGYFKRLNPAWSKLGYTEEELLTRQFLDFVHEDDKAATLVEVERLAGGETTVQFENRYRCLDGSYRRLQWTAVPDGTGHIYAAAHDVTERQQAKEDLERAYAELASASRAKTDFLAMMSHELRTPLNSIIGFSEVLIDGKSGALTEKQTRYLQNVNQSGRHLLGLINDLLDLSKIEAGRLEVMRQPCAPRQLAAEAAATLQPLAEARDVRVTLDPPGSVALPAANADPARFKQVLYNLLSNAIKFAPLGGRVGVTCCRSADGLRIRTTVSDTGAGISPEDQARLFTPFTQLANAREHGGTGLGLALTKQLIEAMDGTITVESAPGEGSRFIVELPIDVRELPVEQQRARGAAGAPLVLIVDDDTAAQELLSLTLQSGGYRTLVCGSGEEGIAEARRQQPDVIILDVFLPTVDGWDVLRVLQSDPQTTKIPVVMVTISSDRRLAFSLGAVEHLVKPIERQALLDTLARRGFTTKVKQRSIHVLAVDDDPKQLELVRTVLEPHGFLVRTEESGRAGAAAALAGPCDLLLLDLVIPDLSGIEVVAALRNDPRAARLPIILMTAHELSAEDRERLNAAVEKVIAKHSVHDLLAEVSAVLRKRA